MRALVTGGLGFIGSNLVDLLLEKDHKVIIIDDLSNNTVPPEFYSDRCEMIISSIEDIDFDYILNIDILFHLASFVGPAGILHHCGEIGHRMVADTKKLCDFCISKFVPFIDISTSEVYGHIGLLKENSEKIFPGEYKVRTEYGAAKMLCEIMLVNKGKVCDDFHYHIIRPFNVAGIRQRPDGGFVLPRFVIAALTKQPLTLFNGGSQYRAFTNVRDICEAILLISESEYGSEIWNIGNLGNKMTIKQLAQRVLKQTGSKSQLLSINPRKIHGSLFAEAVEKIPYTDKIEEKLDWKAKIGIDETIKEVIDYYSVKIADGYFFRVT